MTPGIQRRRETLAVLAWGAVSVALWGAIAPDLVEGIASWTWVRTDGQVMRATLGAATNPSSWRQGSWTSAQLGYYFEVPGVGAAQVHRASRYNAASSIALGGHAMFPMIETALVHEIVRNSGEVTVHYPRGQPERAVLRSGIPIDSAALALCALVPTLLFASALRCLRSRADAPPHAQWILTATPLPFLMSWIPLVSAMVLGFMPPGWLVLALGALPLLAWRFAEYAHRINMAVFYACLIVLPGTVLLWYASAKTMESPAYRPSHEALEQALRVEDDAVRRWALYTLLEDHGWMIRHLRDIGASASEAVPALVAALDSPVDWTRAEAAQALGACGRAAAPAVRSLEARLGDSHGPTRDRAAAALKLIAAPRGN